MFNFIAEILEILYKHVWDSYGMTIILLTVIIRLAVSPLTIKSTKSMLEMRKVQPQVRKLQAQYRQDRVRLNQELTELYRERKINPLGGCLPLLIQMPIFLVMYQVIRGLTRRASDIGYAIGNGVGLLNSSPDGVAAASLTPAERNNFNPDWLDSTDEMFIDLSMDNEMISWGLDLALTPWRVLNEDVVRSLPYIALIILTGVLSYFQQRQIQGRSVEEPNPQQRIIMRIIPIFIPIISFSLPTALVVYFLTTNVVGVAQQAFLTRKIYKPHHEKADQATANGEVDIVDVELDEPAPKPKGLLGALGGQPPEAPKHGKSPLSKSPKVLPPKAASKKPTGQKTQSAGASKSPASKNQNAKNQKNHKNNGSKNNGKNNGNKNNGSKNQSKNQVRKGKNGKGAPPEPPQKVSKRITPKKQAEDQNRRRRR